MWGFDTYFILVESSQLTPYLPPSPSLLNPFTSIITFLQSHPLSSPSLSLRPLFLLSRESPFLVSWPLSIFSPSRICILSLPGFTRRRFTSQRFLLWAWFINHRMGGTNWKVGRKGWSGNTLSSAAYIRKCSINTSSSGFYMYSERERERERMEYKAHFREKNV